LLELIGTFRPVFPQPFLIILNKEIIKREWSLRESEREKERKKGERRMSRYPVPQLGASFLPDLVLLLDL